MRANVTADDVLVDPADSTKLLTGHWADRLRRVDVLIARAGISYVELLDLLETDFLNPPAADGLAPDNDSIDRQERSRHLRS